MTIRSKSDQILDSAESMIRLGGFHAFSFRDIAREVGLKSASVHYHFPTKEDLGAAVMKRYGVRSMAALEELKTERPDDWEFCVRGLANLFIQALERDGKLCLCGMLAAEAAMLPTAVVVEVTDYVEKNIMWLECVLLDGSWTTEQAEARRGANMIFATLEGAMVIALLTGKDATLEDVQNLMIQSMRAKAMASPSSV
jgi:TetR/AcrR family transcriptional repressor of nem operon